MKLTTGNVIFYLILFLLLHPLPSTAMYRNTVKPIKITYHETQPAEETSSSEENCNESTNTVQDLTLQDKIAINAASKQKYLMDIIKRCNWTGFEWVELRHYLLHYMFDLKQLHRVFDLKYNSCDPDNPDDVSSHLFIDSRKHEVEFLEITAETDGTQIINNIVMQIMQTSHLPKHEAFFLVFDAILRHIPPEEREVHPNGFIIKKLEQANSDYRGPHYEHPPLNMEKDETVTSIIKDPHKWLPASVSLMNDAAIMNIQLANIPDILAQLMAFDTGLTQPDSTKTTNLVTAADFINAYSDKDHFTVFTWLVSKRLGYAKTMEGDFYQEEIRLRNAVKKRMREYHRVAEKRPSLAILSIHYFGFNYLIDDATNNVKEKFSPLDGFIIRPDAWLTDDELTRLAHLPEVYYDIQSIASMTGLYDFAHSITKGFCALNQKKTVQILTKIRERYKLRTIALLTGIFEQKKLHQALIQLKNMTYVPVSNN